MMLGAALMHGAELLFWAASYYGSVALSELSSAPKLWAKAVRAESSAQCLSAAAALPSALFMGWLQHAPQRCHQTTQQAVLLLTAPEGSSTCLLAVRRHLSSTTEITCSHHGGRKHLISIPLAWL